MSECIIEWDGHTCLTNYILIFNHIREALESDTLSLFSIEWRELFYSNNSSCSSKAIKLYYSIKGVYGTPIKIIYSTENSIGDFQVQVASDTIQILFYLIEETFGRNLHEWFEK